MKKIKKELVIFKDSINQRRKKMNKFIVAVSIAILLGGVSLAQAQILNDMQLSGVYAGQFETTMDDSIVATGSAVVDQKNIASVAATEGGIIGTSIDNLNTNTISNLGDSAISMQTNISAIAGLGIDFTNPDNIIINTNETTIDNVVDSAIAGQATGNSTGSVMDGANTAFASVDALQSAVAVQNNIAALVGSSDVSGTIISNVNSATVTNVD